MINKANSVNMADLDVTEKIKIKIYKKRTKWSSSILSI